MHLVKAKRLHLAPQTLQCGNVKQSEVLQQHSELPRLFL